MPTSPKREGYDFWEKTLGKPRLLVAPMVDQSELAWRILSRRHGAQLCYTPMFHAAVFSRDPHYRTEALASCAEDKPLIVQFSANDPDDFLRAALLAQDHCDAVDLNLGCPQANAKKGRYGAFLQEDWDAIFNIVSLAHKRLAVPVTCKIRIFEEVSKTVEYAKMLERAGCQMLTVHGRTRDMKGPKTGLANWDVIKAVKQNLSIPVFANGNIQYLSDVERCIEETGVDGIMTAEGNLYNPALFEGVQPPAWEMAEEYLQLVQEYPCPMAFVRGHLFKLWHHSLTTHHDLRARMASAKTLDDFINVSQDLRRVCEEEAKQERPDDSKGIPHWRCQPYIRPTPEETEKRKLEKSLKRPLSEENEQENEQENQVPFMSKKALKKLKQWGKMPNKKGRKFDPCGTCSNPRGLSCVFKLCRACCKDKARQAVEDCPMRCLPANAQELTGHRFLFKTKIERRKYWDAQQAAKALETHTQLPTEHPRCDLSATQTTMPSDPTATLTVVPSDPTATLKDMPSNPTATHTDMPSDPKATLTDVPSDPTAEVIKDRVESELDVVEDTNDERAPSGGLLTVSNISSAVS